MNRAPQVVVTQSVEDIDLDRWALAYVQVLLAIKQRREVATSTPTAAAS